MAAPIAVEGADSPRQPKEDPETLVLRGRPRPVVRFRRGLVIGIAGAVSAALVAVTWAALEPPSFRLVGESETGNPLRDAPPPDALAGAPKNYGDVPRLGPPLPGDLGRPILEHRRSLEGPAPGASVADDAAAAEGERLETAMQAARSSGLMVPLTSSRESSAPTPPPVGRDVAEKAVQPVAVPPVPDSGKQRHKVELARAGTEDASPHALRAAPSPWTLSAGTIIPASLITGLNSDLPGMVIAQVTEQVSDTATGRTVLIPQGARLIGAYDSVVAHGQRRALVVWQRLAFPDGSSVRLDSMPASDLAGFAGLEDRVDFHGWRLLKGIVLSTLLGVGTELGLGGGESELVRAVRESTQQNAARAGDQVTSRNLEVQPTITVRPGWPVRAIVHQDLVLRPWKG